MCAGAGLTACTPFTVGMDTVLVRNHELDVGRPRSRISCAQAQDCCRAPRKVLRSSRIGTGGTTTIVYWVPTDGLAVRRQFLSLAGTLRNCAGGATPWGSWLSCEESVLARWTSVVRGAIMVTSSRFLRRRQELIDPHPLKGDGAVSSRGCGSRS